MVKSYILLAVLLVAAYSQVIDHRECPPVQVVQDFNLTAYLGTWYESSRYWDYTQKGTKCNTIVYDLRVNGSIKFESYNVFIALNHSQRSGGTANIVGDGSEGRIDFANWILGEHMILGTDYTSWAAVWRCEYIVSAESVRYAWLWTRERNPSEEVLNATIDALARNGLETNILMDIDNENCPEF